MKRWTVWLLCLLVALAGFACAKSGDDDDSAGDDDTGGDDTGDDDVDTTPPAITDTTDLPDTLDATGPYTVSATVTDDVAVAAATLSYRVDGGAFTDVPMTAAGDVYSADIPGQAAGSLVEYYVTASDTSANEATDPADAPTSVYDFHILTAETYATDDGEADNASGFASADTMGVKIYTPSGYPSVLTSVSIFLAGQTDYTADYELVVLADPTGGTPEDATQAWTSGQITELPPVWPDGEWKEIDLGDALADTPLEAGTWVVGIRWGAAAAHRGPFVGVDLSAGNDPNSYAYAGAWDTLLNFGVDGQWMIRATGYY